MYGIYELWILQNGAVEKDIRNSDQECVCFDSKKIKWQVAARVVGLAMVLRRKPDALTPVLPMLRWRPRYLGQDKLPLIVWMLA
uniref:Uncharacterized protein n=1 Tax=Noccaea caerulescens TaxID=107243 RepID=A0A1J3GFC3_NOCCA